MEAVIMEGGKKLGTILLPTTTFSSGKTGYQQVGIVAELDEVTYKVNFMLIKTKNKGPGFIPA